jgi:hypothetical protein
VAIEWVAASTQATSTSSPLTANLPSGYKTGDLLVAIITTREDSPTPVHGIATSSVSWTQIGSTLFLDLGTTGIAQSCWYRFAASASETAPSASCPTPNVLAVTVVALRYVDQTTPLDGVTPLGDTAAAAATLQPNGATGITTATNGAWVVSAVSTADDNALNLSTANGFTVRISGTNYDTTDGGDCSQGIATIEKATAGAQTSCTWNQSANGNDAWAWQLFALRPATIVTGTVSSAAGGLTASAAGTKATTVTGTVASAAGTLTGAAAGSRVHTGTVSSAAGTLTATATGTRTAAVVTGTVASAAGTLTASAAGTRVHTATVSSIAGTLTATAAGSRTVYGTVASAAGSLTATATGTSAGVVGGTVSSAAGTLTATATGTRVHTGSVASAAGTLTATAAGTRTAGVTTGTVSSAAGTLTGSAAGTRTVHGAVSSVAGELTAGALGSRAHTGTIASIAGALLAVAVGSLYRASLHPATVTITSSGHTDTITAERARATVTSTAGTETIGGGDHTATAREPARTTTTLQELR